LDLGSLTNLRLVRVAAIGALVAALGLAGCGRKGGLDPPPGASVVDPGVAVVPGAGPGATPETMPDGRPLAPQAPKRSTPIDFLID
jgi:predicted small lipoprotein YifL